MRLKAGEDKPLTRAEWLIDGMAAVQAVPPKSTWNEYAESLLQCCTPPTTYNLVRVAIIMDTYRERRINNQKKRGQSCHQGRRIFITEPGQSMPRAKIGLPSSAMERTKQSWFASWLSTTKAKLSGIFFIDLVLIFLYVILFDWYVMLFEW